MSTILKEVIDQLYEKVEARIAGLLADGIDYRDIYLVYPAGYQPTRFDEAAQSFYLVGPEIRVRRKQENPNV